MVFVEHYSQVVFISRCISIFEIMFPIVQEWSLRIGGICEKVVFNPGSTVRIFKGRGFQGGQRNIPKTKGD